MCRIVFKSFLKPYILGFLIGIPSSTQQSLSSLSINCRQMSRNPHPVHNGQCFHDYTNILFGGVNEIMLIPHTFNILSHFLWQFFHLKTLMHTLFEWGGGLVYILYNCENVHNYEQPPIHFPIYLCTGLYTLEYHN